jgi:formate dehydrogenase (NADP+) beta subunit
MATNMQQKHEEPKFKVKAPDAEFFKQLIPCQAACPVHTDAGRYVQLIAQGQHEQAYLTACSPNPFASVCGRVCAAPCEDFCRRGVVDKPVSIRALKGFVCELYGPESSAPVARQALAAGGTDPGNKVSWHLPILAETRKQVGKEKKVAVIGAGPAGMSCAHDLAVMGYRPTVFEASAIPGGMMVLGIPEFRLNRDLLNREIQTVLDLGVELKLNTPLGPEFGINELRQQGFEAVFLAVGTQAGREMNIEGSNLDGILKAVDFLLNVNRGYKVTLGRRVVVIGGGFVAFDAARAALRSDSPDLPDPSGNLHTALDSARAAIRAGVEEVRIVSLESFQEMPVLRSQQGHEEFEEAQHEGIIFQTQRGAQRFVGKNGRLSAIELIGVTRTYDENGRFNPLYDSQVQETIEADLAILAIGQRTELSFLRPENGVALTAQGTVKVDPATLATSSPGIFAGGDAAFGPRNLIEAIANGKRAAQSIDDYLRDKEVVRTTQISFRKLTTRSYRMPDDYDKIPRQAPSTLPLDRRTGVAQVELGYSEVEAREQAERCLACHIQTIYDAEKCILCGRCVDVCPNQCLKLVPLEELGLENASLSEVAAHYGFAPERNGLASAMIKDETDCIRCGLCAIRCPTDAMTMEVLFYEDHEAVASGRG